eukprot:CAMPEP_0185689614 /NCGR_PEP_ID=MMETSP1164-20130828/573_1 /TAXON_ID=1104430 /ORGANISM="Chrysoreinhardia sp, Strain CCMP2950" /LENGTH=133 /DNA_ID=CAMNT_0028356119 /DNA_START=71 /DNA_END=472 /DNA_ORIENTATION=-
MKKLSTGLISTGVLPGAMMIAVGLAPALVPAAFASELPKMTALWSEKFGVDLKPGYFFPFVGACKLFGIASMWGLFGTVADYVCSILYAVLCGFATYQHRAFGEPIAPPVVIGTLCLVRLGLDMAAKSKAKAT